MVLLQGDANGKKADVGLSHSLELDIYKFRYGEATTCFLNRSPNPAPRS